MRRTRLSLRSPKAIRKVALLQHINTSFPSFQMMHSTSSEQACHFFGLGLYFSLIYPPGTWGQGCTGRYLYWYVFSSILLFTPNFCDMCWTQTKVSLMFWRAERKGETEGKRKTEKENQSGKFKVCYILIFLTEERILLMVPLLAMGSSSEELVVKGMSFEIDFLDSNPVSII